MKRKLQIIISASAASVLAFSVLAQDTPNSKKEGPVFTRDRLSAEQRDNGNNGSAKASDVIGTTVKNYQDKKLGKVDDLALDLESGRIVQVILTSGGFIGIGDTLTAVPPEAFHSDDTEKVLRLNADKEKLEAAPKFDNAKWDEGAASNRVSEVYAYFGEQPYFEANREGYRTKNIDGSRAERLPRNTDGTINTDGESTVDKFHDSETAHNFEKTNRNISARNPDGTRTREYYAKELAANNSSSELGYVQRASKLMGTLVKNLQDEKLGKVENIMVDLSSGRIIAVVISSGGFIGIGDELSAVPPTALRYNTTHDILQLDASKEVLVASPHFKSNHWPDFGEPEYVGGIYGAYNVEPYFSTNVTSEPFNAARNVRDRDDHALTPLDQGNSQADLDTTAQIRKEIIAGKDMSVNAMNVKIITINGQVTLRGPVNTDEEKRLLGEIANRFAPSGNVDNQLEVKLNQRQ